MKRWSLIICISLCVLAGVIMYVSVTQMSLFQFGQPGSGLLPFLLGLILEILSLILIFTGEAAAAKDKAFFLPGSALRLILVVVIFIVSGLVFQYLGAPVTVGLLVASWLTLLEHKRVQTAIITGGLTALCIWLVFCVAFKAQLPMGIWVR